MENNEVVKNKESYKFDLINGAVTGVGLVSIVVGIQKIIDNNINFIGWFSFILGILMFIFGSIAYLVILLKRIKKGRVK